ncbi:MAG TPA: CHASE4 domain-containing protein, partial [Gammaproteobacteria bacterium]|nr:CHASE4 domain-containing protein [Gammaproteobacteria bacterium]
MKLGTKVLLVIFLTWTFMVWATYIGSTKILEKSYLLLEDKQQARDINQIHEVINALLINNDINLKAWADWDEMYQFAVDHDKKFLDANITPASLANFYIDLFLIYDINGNPLFTQELNSDRSKFLPMPHEIAQLFNKRGILNRLVTLPESDNDVVGLVLVPSKGILGFASRRILNSEEKGPAHGTLISVQYINETVLQELRKQSKLDIYLFTLPQIQKNAELNKEFTRVLVTGKDDARVNHNEKTIFLYYILRDINHKPIGFIKTIVPRDIRIAGKNTVFYFNVALTTTGIIFAIMLFYLIRSLVIIRLEKINNKLGNIIKENNFTLRVPDEGKDELSSVGTEMNKMLSTISSVESVLTDTINSMPSMLIIIDNSIHITNLNYLAEKELGLTSEKAKGKPLFDLFPFLLMYEDKITDSIKNTLVQEIKKISYTTDKNSRFLNVIIFPLHQSREKTIAIRIDDISERIKLEERLMQTDKLTSVGILTTGVASEIDEPIHYIYNSVEPIKKN